MNKLLVTACAMSLALFSAALASDVLPEGAVLDTDTTSAGQPLILPPRPRLHAAVFVDPPGWSSEWHLHRFPRYVYVLEGTLTVEAEDGSRSSVPAGHMSVEMLDRWHHGMNLGPGPVKFLVIDQVEPGSGPNMILRAK